MVSLRGDVKVEKLISWSIVVVHKEYPKENE